jgi:hypothetical protein
MVPSYDADADASWPVAENATDVTPRLWPSRVCRHAPEAGS